MGATSLFESVPNFSEGRRTDVVHAIASAAGAAHLLDADSDADHNRAVLSIAGDAGHVAAALISALHVAVVRIDVRGHQGVHPMVGAADVVPIVPLGSTTFEQSRELALQIGHRIWSELAVPVYFYGRETGRTLADIRAGRAKPDLGGPDHHPTAGAVCVGARSALIAYNVMLPAIDARAARALARALRESAGGLRGVQALAFELPGGRTQLSMNLFRLEETTPADVEAELRRRGVQLGEQQVVGLCPAAAAPPAAAGRVLEARMAAAATRTAASRCRSRGDEEHLALAVRLDREAGNLGALGVDQDSLLSAAERSAALIRVLNAAQVLDAELEAMLSIAARGLFSALSQKTRAAYPERSAALVRLL
ncbi:MAG: glutamate formiminotransferase [Candidatus Dormibacterales bacterium]